MRASSCYNKTPRSHKQLDTELTTVQTWTQPKRLQQSQKQQRRTTKGSRRKQKRQKTKAAPLPMQWQPNWTLSGKFMFDSVVGFSGLKTK